MKKKLKNWGAILLIIAILLCMLAPAFSTSMHSFRIATTIESMRSSIEHELKIRRKANIVFCVACALAGAGVSLLIVSCAMGKTDLTKESS